jgi:hypothetical protein
MDQPIHIALNVYIYNNKLARLAHCLYAYPYVFQKTKRVSKHETLSTLPHRCSSDFLWQLSEEESRNPGELFCTFHKPASLSLSI